MSSNKEIAVRVLDAVGGKENVNSVVHCATRLRFKLKDEHKADTARLNQDDDVIQVVQSGGQYQVVIGSHVSDGGYYFVDLYAIFRRNGRCRGLKRILDAGSHLELVSG